jgi:hypothetical protein
MSPALKSILFSLIGIYILFLSTSLVQAAGVPLDSKNYKAPENSDYALINLQHSALCQMAGMSPVSKCIGLTKEKGKVKAYLYDALPNGGALGAVTGVITAMYTPPTSTTQYVADVGIGLGIVDKAHAQVLGSGSSVVFPVLKLWQVVRNLVYVLYILIFIVVGVMIMLRQKMSAQAVVSIETALPGLVIGLILVTFSYLISSLLIDTAFFGMQVVGQIFSQNGLNNLYGNANQIQSLANNSNIFSFFTSSIRFGSDFSDVASGTSSLLNSVITGRDTGASTGITGAIGAIIFGVIGFIVLGPLGGAVGAIGGAALPLIIGLIIPVILVVALLVMFVRLSFSLINAYIMLLISTIIGPFVILYSSIPGKGGSLGFWWKTILANALIFPAVFAGFLFAGVILGDNASVTAIGDQTWGSVPPFFGNLRPDLVRLIIAYGILLGIPAIPGMVKGMMGVKDIGEIGKMAAQNFGLGATGAGIGGALLGKSGLKTAYEANPVGIHRYWGLGGDSGTPNAARDLDAAGNPRGDAMFRQNTARRLERWFKFLKD